MSGAATAAEVALTDALVEAAQFGRALYPHNVVCNDDERVSAHVQSVLADDGEQYPVDLALGWTHVLVGPTGRALPVAPGTPRADVDVRCRACAPAWAVCDYCSGHPAPVAGLLPVPAGASVVVLCLCKPCSTFLADHFSSAHFIALED